MVFLQRKSTILGMRQRLLDFFLFSTQLEHSEDTYSHINELLLNLTDILIQPRKQRMIYIISQVYTKIEVTSIIQHSHDLEDSDDIIICPALTTTQNRQFTIEGLTIVEDDLMEKLKFLILPFQSRLLETFVFFQNTQFFWFISETELNFLRNYRYASSK